MSSNSFQVFKTSEDRNNWKKIAEYVRLHSELTETDKDEIEKSLEYLSITLGKDFLSTSAKFNHPLYQHFRNLAPWALKWSVWLSKALENLIKNDLNRKLLSGLKSKWRNEEAFTFLEINHHLTLAGFSIRFEEEVKVGEGSRFPDLRLENRNVSEVIYLELSSLHMHIEHDWNSSTFRQLSNAFSAGMLEMNLHYCGKFRSVTRDNVENVKQQIEAFKSSINGKDRIYTIENEFMELGIAAESHLNELGQWAMQRDIRLNSVMGEPISLKREIDRIKKKIKDKAQQLSSEHLNVIGISAHPLFMMAGDKISMLVDLVGYFEQIPHLFGVLVFGHNPLARMVNKNGETPPLDWHLEAFGHLISSHTVADFKTTEFYFARNFECPQPSVQTLEMFYNAFRFGNRIEAVVEEK